MGRRLVRYATFLVYSIIFLVAISCGGQKREPKQNSVRVLQEPEVYKTGTRKSVPLGNESAVYVPGEVLVRFEDGTDSQVIEAIQKEMNLTTVQIVSKPYLYLMKIPDSGSVEEIVEKLKDYQEVAYSEPNYLRRAY